MPSLVAETSSLVAIEALACGTPVVAFPAGALGEIIEPGVTGFLVRPKDSAGVAEAVIRLLQDKSLATRLGAHGRELVREEFSEELMVRKIDALYRQLTS